MVKMSHVCCSRFFGIDMQHADATGQFRKHDEEVDEYMDINSRSRVVCKEQTRRDSQQQY
jgi:hypothetical protein